MPDVILSQFVMIGFILIVGIAVGALLIEFGVFRVKDRNKTSRMMAIGLIIGFYAFIIVAAFFALQSGLMSIPDLDPFTMRSAFDAISLLLIAAVVIPVFIFALYFFIVRHK